MPEVDPTIFRHVFGRLATGVTVIAANADDGPVGMAANSVASVSLEPPLVLFCPAKSSSTWPKIRAVGQFCVSVLAGDHVNLTRNFAAQGVDRFSDVAYDTGMAGPALCGAVAWIDCSVDVEHDAGDHTIVVARVLTLEAAMHVEPLVFFGGSYGSFRAHTSD